MIGLLINKNLMLFEHNKAPTMDSQYIVYTFRKQYPDDSTLPERAFYLTSV